MRHLSILSLLCFVILVSQCGRDSPNGTPGYKAPRNLGESVKSWYDGRSEGSSAMLFVGDCPKPYTSYLDIPLECSPWYLGTEEAWNGLPASLKVHWEYAALLDFDYSPEPVLPYFYAENSPISTRLEVRKVIEEYLNLLPNGTWDDIVVVGKCDEKGHCIMDEGGYPMPLWSGVNLVFGEITCHVNGPAVLTISEVYAVEGDLIYDFYGFAYSWPEMRKMLIEAGKEAMATRPLKCVPSEETAPSENPQSSPNNQAAPGEPDCSCGEPVQGQ